MSGKDGFFGKYRGIVTDNRDPERTGRLMVQVPDVSGIQPSTWALPCLPVAGARSGFYAVPPIHSAVWVEFEQGDPGYPIWVGCFWETMAAVPALALAGTPALPDPQQIVVQTVNQNALLISDTPGPAGGILLKSSAGALISLSDAGITISNGQGAAITLTGRTVTVNEGALEVT